MTFENDSRATWITKAANEPGVSELLTELPKLEATELRQRIEECSSFRATTGSGSG